MSVLIGLPTDIDKKIKILREKFPNVDCGHRWLDIDA